MDKNDSERLLKIFLNFVILTRDAQCSQGGNRPLSPVHVIMPIINFGTFLTNIVHKIFPA